MPLLRTTSRRRADVPDWTRSTHCVPSITRGVIRGGNTSDGVGGSSPGGRPSFGSAFTRTSQTSFPASILITYGPRGRSREGSVPHIPCPWCARTRVNGPSQDGRIGDFPPSAVAYVAPFARRPLNAVELTRGDQGQRDQPGCVHANMDLFKWTLQMWPMLSSEDLVDSLELAMACRMLVSWASWWCCRNSTCF